MTIKGMIKSIALLESLTDEQIEEMEGYSEVVNFKKGEKLFQVGHMAKNIFILLDGKVSIQVQLSSRPENMSIVVLQKLGQLVGWSGLMGGSHYTANGVCLEDSQLLKIDGQQFLQTLDNNPETGLSVMYAIAAVISQRLRNLQSVVLKTI
jgi:CRP-like cAMP-binding protein